MRRFRTPDGRILAASTTEIGVLYASDIGLPPCEWKAFTLIGEDGNARIFSPLVTFQRGNDVEYTMYRDRLTGELLMVLND